METTLKSLNLIAQVKLIKLSLHMSVILMVVLSVLTASFNRIEGGEMQSFDIESPNIKERIVAKNELAFSFPSYMPIVPGHLLICPIRKVEKVEDLTKEELQAIMDLRGKLCKALKIAVDAEGFNFAWNEGENAGQSVAHFHLHVVPRKNGDTGILEYEPRVFLYRPGSRATSSSQELTEVAKLIRKFLD